MHTLKTSWILRHTVLLCVGFMVSFSLSSQITITPRVGYTSNQYRITCPLLSECNGRSKSFSVGLHNSYNMYKELSVVADVNFYIDKLYFSRLGPDFNFNYYDFKIGLSNNIFNDKTAYGIGLQMEILYNIEGTRNGTLTEFENESQYGIEFSVSHTVGKVELFFDLYYNLSFKDGNNNRINTIRKIVVLHIRN